MRAQPAAAYGIAPSQLRTRANGRRRGAHHGISGHRVNGAASRSGAGANSMARHRKRRSCGVACHCNVPRKSSWQSAAAAQRETKIGIGGGMAAQRLSLLRLARQRQAKTGGASWRGGEISTNKKRLK